MQLEDEREAMRLKPPVAEQEANRAQPGVTAGQVIGGVWIVHPALRVVPVCAVAEDVPGRPQAPCLAESSSSRKTGYAYGSLSRGAHLRNRSPLASECVRLERIAAVE